jgi:predicted alpha-1,2-mannosidase
MSHYYNIGHTLAKTKAMALLVAFFVTCESFATPYNIAPRAKVTVSSQTGDAFGANCLTDGIIRIDGKGEWVSNSKQQFWGAIDFPWAQLEWAQPVCIDKVVLYDRPSMKAYSAGCTLILDDGTRIAVDEIANNGAPREVTFAPHRTKTLRVELNDGMGEHLGLSEIEIYSPAGDMADYVSTVNPFIETNKGRYFFFCTGSMPFGLISAAPLTRNSNQGGGGYNYNSNEILGFPQIHAWMMSGLDFMPVTNGMPLTENEWKSEFSHAGEVAQPAYHRLFLEKYNTWVEQTCTNRVSLYRMTYTKDAKAQLLMNLGGYLGTTTMVNAHAHKTSSQEIEGWFDTTGRLWGGPDNIRAFFVASFNKPFESLTAWFDHEVMENADSVVGPKESVARNEGMTYRDAASAGIRALYDVKAGDQLMVKFSISYTSIDNARKNMDEMPGWDFDSIRSTSQKVWNEWMGRIEVKGGSREQRVKFYTDLWHILLGRHSISDLNGDYPDYTNGTRDGNYVHNATLKVRNAKKYQMINSDSFWLTQWNLNTLWGMAWPEVLDNFAASLVQYSLNGGLLPRGPNVGGYSYIMSGCPVSSLLSGAYQRSICHLWNPKTALKAMVRNHEKGGMMAIGMDNDLDFYEAHGYVPERGGLTVEWSFQDWALAQMAKKMGQKKVADRFLKRSHGWVNSYNEKHKLVFPRRKDGSWLHEDPLNGWGFEESNAWQTTFGLSHDLQKLAELMGGSNVLCQRLDSAMRLSEDYDFVRNYGFGYVCYSNEPGLGTAHVFSHLGQPWLTQYWVREIQRRAYGATTPSEGYGGEDEDQGQMACMSALMAMGLFSIDGCCSTEPMYELTSPVFDEITIHLNPNYYKGKEFKIITHNASKANCYIQHATWNGSEWPYFQLPHKMFAQGGVMEIWLSDKPNKKWGQPKL